MAETKPSKIVIDPSDRVVEALRLAVVKVGVEELLKRTNVPHKLLEKWINGEERVPLNVVIEACEINRNNQEAPSYSKILSECTTGASFGIVVEQEIEKPEAKVVKEIMSLPPYIPAQKIAEPKVKALKSEAVRQMVRVSAALFSIPILSVVLGFLFEGFIGAVAGAILGFVIITALTFVFFVLFPKQSRRT